MLNQDRLVHLTHLMTERAWDLLLAYGHSWRKDFFRYLLNVNFSGPHAVVALSRSGEMHAIVSDPWDAECLSRYLPGRVSVAPDLTRGLQELASSQAGSIAIAGRELMEARLVEAIRESSRCEPASATLAIEEMRRVKTRGEIERLRKAAALADRGYQHFAQVIEIGMTEYELVAEVEAFLKRHGAEDNFMLISSGGTEVTGMKPPTERKFQRGDSVCTELTPQVDGYYAQICRTLVLGEPSAPQRESFAIFQQAQQAALDVLRPGVNISEVARAQNEIFRKHGYGDYTGPKYTRVRGHNLGLHLDENPYVLEDVDYVVKKDMVLIAHPNTYLPLSGYMVFGDSLLVTSHGCESLNTTERKLFRK